MKEKFLRLIYTTYSVLVLVHSTGKRASPYSEAARKYSRMAATPLAQTSRGGLLRGLPDRNSCPPSRPVSWPNVEGRAVSSLPYRFSASRPVSWPNASGRAVSWFCCRSRGRVALSICRLSLVPPLPKSEIKSFLR